MPPDEVTPDETIDSELEDAAAARLAPAAEEGDEETDSVGDGEAGEPEPEETDDAATDDGDGEGDEGSAEGTSSPPPAALTDDEIQSFVQLRDYLSANPVVAGEIAGVLERAATGQPPAAPTPPPTPETPQPPEGLDLDDPQIAALWNQHLATLETVKQIQERQQQYDHFVTQQRMETTQSLLNQAREAFSKDHELSPDEMEKVVALTGELQILPALLSPTDPVTGLSRTVDPIAAMKQAFEVARWNIPELREREFRAVVDDGKADNKRKAKLSSISGSSGSTPRTAAAVPKDPAERRAAMVAEVARMTQGEGASE